MSGDIGGLGVRKGDAASAGDPIIVRGDATGDGTAGDPYIVAAPVPLITSYEDGTIFIIRFGSSNAEISPEININGIGLKSIELYQGGGILQPGDVFGDGQLIMVYGSDEDEFRLGSLSLSETFNIAATVDTNIIGEIRMHSGTTAPPKWEFCDNAELNRTTYVNLFSVTGTTYGVGNGTTTFNVPDMRGRIPMGIGTGDASTPTAHTLGEKEGDEVHTLTIAEMPSHAHDPQALADAADVDDPTNAYIAAPSETTFDFAATQDANMAATDTTGDGDAHNILQSSLGVNFIIYTGV